MDLTFRTLGPWGAGKGANLEAAEVDDNFWSLAQAIFDLQNNPAVPNGIASIAVSGTQMTITLHDGTVLGPYTLPVLTFRWRGEWQPSTSYAVLDVFTVTATGIFMVQIAHTTGATFDPNLLVGGLPAYLMLFGSADASLSSLSDVQITSLQNHDFLRWVAADSKWENIALGGMAYQQSTAVAITGGTITGLGTPANPADAATKAYVDAITGSVPGGTAGQVQYNNAGHFAGSSGATFSATQLTSLVVGLGSDATGDIWYRNAAGNFTRLPIGIAGQVLEVASGLPAWASISVLGGTVGTGTGPQLAQYASGTGTTVGGVTLSGDATIAAGGALTLATVNSNVGSFQGLTIDAKGRVTAATAVGYITGNQTITLSGDVSGAGSTAINVTLPATGVAAGNYTNTNLTVDAKGRITAATNGTGGTGGGGLSGMTPGQIPIAASMNTVTSSANLSGDVTTNATLVATLTSTAVTPGSYTNTNLTVDAKGRIIAAANGAGAAGTGNLIARRIFAANATYTPTAGTGFVIVTVVGGAGAGGGVAATSATQQAEGSGGGSGGVIQKTITSAFSGVPIVVGAGGTAASGAAGGNGSPSSFGTYTAGAGSGGALGAAGANAGVAGGAGGTATGGDLNLPGERGWVSSAVLNGGNTASGRGASTPFGFGSGGEEQMGSAAGIAGYGYGSGGSGAINGASQSARAGGNGAPGVVIVDEYGSAGSTPASVVSSIAAAGTNQATATAVLTTQCYVSGASGTNGVVIDPSLMTAGNQLYVVNTGSNALLVYPPSGATINSQAVNTSINVSANGTALFIVQSGTQLRSVP